eukprot:Trichotokara_eunicae@DN3890_c0_g1_i3.p1
MTRDELNVSLGRLMGVEDVTRQGVAMNSCLKTLDGRLGKMKAAAAFIDTAGEMSLAQFREECLSSFTTTDENRAFDAFKNEVADKEDVFLDLKNTLAHDISEVERTADHFLGWREKFVDQNEDMIEFTNSVVSALQCFVDGTEGRKFFEGLEEHASAFCHQIDDFVEERQAQSKKCLQSLLKTQGKESMLTGRRS